MTRYAQDLIISKSRETGNKPFLLKTKRELWDKIREALFFGAESVNSDKSTVHKFAALKRIIK